MDTIEINERNKYLESLIILEKRLKIGDNMEKEKEKINYLFVLQNFVNEKDYINPAAQLIENSI